MAKKKNKKKDSYVHAVERRQQLEDIQFLQKLRNGVIKLPKGEKPKQLSALEWIIFNYNTTAKVYNLHLPSTVYHDHQIAFEKSVQLNKEILENNGNKYFVIGFHNKASVRVKISEKFISKIDGCFIYNESPLKQIDVRKKSSKLDQSSEVGIKINKRLRSAPTSRIVETKQIMEENMPEELDKLFDVIIHVVKLGMTRKDAVLTVSKKRNILLGSVLGKNIRDINQNTNEIDRLLRKKYHPQFQQILEKKFPFHKNSIKLFFSKLDK